MIVIETVDANHGGETIVSLTLVPKSLGGGYQEQAIIKISVFFDFQNERRKRREKDKTTSILGLLQEFVDWIRRRTIPMSRFCSLRRAG